MIARGAVHLHTTLSHDGVLSLAELVAFLRPKGYDYLVITEHSQDMTERKVADLIQESTARSEHGFLIMPGIEFTCDHSIHILGVGVTALCTKTAPGQVIDHIHEHGGLAVLAHPTIKPYPLDRHWVAMLDGCEIWNNREGKFLPQLRSIRKFRELVSWAPHMRAFGDLDLHGPLGFSYISVSTQVKDLSREAILTSLKEGAFQIENRFIRIGADGKIGVVRMIYLTVFRTLLNAARWLRNRLRPQA